MLANPAARLIAFYLPQFHPIPENDGWWSKGFTEWTNVAKAKPLFPGHYQPNLPADLGFYDLRVPETRIAQAELARTYGIEGFMYWHYWFAGRRLLERPFKEVLRSGEPDFPFCLGWANQSWTGIWHGAPNRILMEQTYPGRADDEAHFYALVEAFCDRRYITVENKPVFFVFRPHELPESRRSTDCWRELAVKAGLKGIYFIGVPAEVWWNWNPIEHGFDASALNNLFPAFGEVDRTHYGILDRISLRITQKDQRQLVRKLLGWPKIISYGDTLKLSITSLVTNFDQYPGVMPNWDNTPRSGANGIVFHGSSPELFRQHLRQTIAQVSSRQLDKRIIVVKSWNEWAEGNYLEPDQKYGRGYLEVLRDEVFGLGQAGE